MHRQAPLGLVQACRFLRGVERAANVPLLDGATVRGANHKIVVERVRSAQLPGDEQAPQRRNERHDPIARLRLWRSGGSVPAHRDSDRNAARGQVNIAPPQRANLAEP